MKVVKVFLNFEDKEGAGEERGTSEKNDPDRRTARNRPMTRELPDDPKSNGRSEEADQV